ncbi:MAG: nucleotidyltransferase family protein [Geminicoccaceae bacterium]|nr:nucleotidyltransferase family protein [Geminicoccaceae bacterium]
MSEPNHMSNIHAVVQAGGKGERLRPLTADRPKPMLEVGGVPMFERVVRGLINAGIDRITIVVAYRADMIRDHVETMNLPRRVRIDFFEETNMLGNAGALGRIGVERKYALLAFGDLVTDLDFSTFAQRGFVEGCDILLASHKEEHRLQLGEIVVDGNEVLAYREKPLKTFLICSGIALFRRDCLSVILGDDGCPFGISDLITAALKCGHTVKHWEHGAFWMDVNTLEALDEANRIIALKTSPQHAFPPP